MPTTDTAAETAAPDETAAQDTGQAAEEIEAEPFDLLAAAEQAAARAADEAADPAGAAAVEQQAASQARAHAGRARAEAEALASAAEAEVRRILAAAREEGRGLAESAALADKLAGVLEDRARLHGDVAAGQQHAAAMARAAALESDRAGLGEQVEVLDGRLTALAGDRQAADARLAAARQAADVPAIAAERATLAAMDDARAALQGQRGALQGRYDAIGPAEGPGELADARTAASRHLAAAQRARDELFPDSMGAVMARAADKFMAAFEANAERIADEQRAEQAKRGPRPHTIIRMS